MIADIPPAPWLSEKFHFTPQSIKFLGKGATSFVYEMISKDKNVHYAVKTIFFHINEDLNSNLKEIKLLKEFSHPNIVKIFDYHHWKSPPHQYLFLVNELGNESLSSFLSKKKNLIELEFYEMVDQLVEAVYECHQHNIVHFDIKPDNIIIFEEKKIKISDFGSAQKLLGEGTLPLLTDSISMTKNFASPEILKIFNDNKFNKLKSKFNWGKMDVYSLGLTFLNMMGLEISTFDSFKQIADETIYDTELMKILTLIVEKNKFQNDWIKLLFSMLRVNPNQRFSVEEVKLSLKKMKSTGSNNQIIHQLIVEQATMDLVFVLDTTGSMDKYAYAIMTSLKHNIFEMKKSKAKRKVRIGFIFYKDKQTKIDNDLMKELMDNNEFSKEAFLCNYEEPKDFLKDLRPYNEYINIIDFTHDIHFIENKLSQVKCQGGWDECEDLTEALNSALTLDWTPSNKMKTLVIITDAPPHGKRYHDGKSLDDYLEDDQKFDNIEEIVRKLCKKEIGIMGLEISKKTQKMYEIIKKSYEENKGIFVKSICNEECQFTQHKINDWFKETFLDEIDSIFSRQWEIYFKDKISDSINWNKQIDWDVNFDHASSIGMTTKIYSAQIVKQTLDFYHLDQLILNISETDEKLEGLIMNKSILQGSQMKIYLYKTKSENEKTVIKIPLANDSTFQKVKDLEMIWKIYLLTQFFLEKFNEELSLENDLKKLKFLDLFALKVKGETFQKYKFLFCEKFLDGIFMKYNSNNGWSQKYEKGVTYETNLLCQSFSHFSYVYSKGRLVICDLQGVENTLTDPAINSVEQIFGDTDLGKYGIYKFFKTHICNHYCEELDVEPSKKVLENYKVEQKILEENPEEDYEENQNTTKKKNRK